jgi:Tfp pilus assembly protein FimT
MVKTATRTTSATGKTVSKSKDLGRGAIPSLPRRRHVASASMLTRYRVRACHPRSSNYPHFHLMSHEALRPSRRSGLTLVEICLVLALLVVIASFAMPLLGGAIERRSLVSGAGLLEAGWTRGRLAAMQSGQTFVVRFEPKGSRFQVLSLEQLALPESQAMQSENQDAEHTPYDIQRLFKTRLPDGVIFGRADVATSNQLTATMGTAGDGPWSSPILFRPDGTTSDASVLLVNEPGQTVRVTLRGLTGTSIASEVGREDVP